MRDLTVHGDAVMTWYPEIDGKELPWSIAFTPTEPLLSPTRKVIPKVRPVPAPPAPCRRVSPATAGCRSRAAGAHRAAPRPRRPARQVNGVDVTPIVWVAVLSLANETLLGPQGILVILAKKAASS